MLSNQKYRINTLAKDLKIKSKDIIDILENKGITGKAHMAVIDPDEFNIIIDTLSRERKFEKLNDYIDGKYTIQIKKAKPESVKPQKSSVISGEPAEAPVIPAVQEETKPDVQPPAPIAENVQEDQPKPAQAQNNKDNKDNINKADPKPHRQFNGQNAEQRPRANTNGSKPRDPDNAVVQADNVKQPFRNRFENKPQFQNNKIKQQRPKTEQKPQITPQTKNTEKPFVEIKTVEENTNRTTRVSEAKIIDTRTSSVDLAKYDERLEKLAPEHQYKRETNAPDKLKLKKQNNRDPRQDSRRNDKERLAMEKLKKLEAEKAKKHQLSVSIPDEITVGDLAAKLKVTAAEVIKRLMLLGSMVNVNQVVDYDTAYLVADELGAKVTREVVVTIEQKLFEEAAENTEDLVARPPVVVIMGHVDHGKTSLLDAIRNTNVTEGEAGGITQHIGAYSVNIHGKDITFLDTPGHEAFTAMRARGAKATDIAVLVVAADDGIMPQTIEAINHAKEAELDIIVAINKMDMPTARPDIIMQNLTKYDLVPEEWGGETICVPVSATAKTGIENLLENILLVAEMKDLKANPNKRAKGVVIEARLDKGRGPVATVLVQNGTLRNGDVVIAGTSVGHVRAMINDKGQLLKSAAPSVPVEIVGLAEVPVAGDEFNAVEDERMARELAEQRRTKNREDEFKVNANVNLNDLFSRINEGTKDLNIIVKADVGGSAEAVKSALEKLTNNEVRIRVIHTGVGGITESDVMLATASNAVIIGFNVRPDKSAIDSAERQKVDVRTYRIIYECIEEITAAMKGMLSPKFKEEVIGHVAVRQIIHVPNVGVIAGSYVQDGKIKNSARIRILRDSVVIYEDKISSLRRFKDDAKEVQQGFECGVGLEKFSDIKENDIFEVYETVMVENK